MWVVDAASGAERLLADPAELIGDDDASLPPAELARRERTREAAGGITSFAIDRDATIASFAVAGRLFVCDVESGVTRELTVGGPVFDPRPDPLGHRIAYVSGGTLRVVELDGMWRVLAGGDDEPETVTWGSADFIAAEEMRRQRGYWWNPDGSMIAATRVDTACVATAWISDPAQPSTAARSTPYPFAGTDNADVSLHLVGLAGEVVDVDWDRAGFPYLADAHWSAAGLIISTQSRSQRALEILDVDVESGQTTVRFADSDDRWVELVSGTPRLWTRRRTRHLRRSGRRSAVAGRR